jgi:hypothetical protein
MREIRTSGLMSGEGKRGVAARPKLPRPSSTLPSAGGWIDPTLSRRGCGPALPYNRGSLYPACIFRRRGIRSIGGLFRNTSQQRGRLRLRDEAVRATSSSATPFTAFCKHGLPPVLVSERAPSSEFLTALCKSVYSGN